MKNTNTKNIITNKHNHTINTLILRSKHCLYDHKYLLTILTVYFLSAFTLQEILGIPILKSIPFYYKALNSFILIFLFIFFALKYIFHIKYGFGGIQLLLKDLSKNYFSLDPILRFILIYSTIPIFICTYSSFKNAIPSIRSFVWDSRLMDLDYVLHFGNHPWELLQPLIGHPFATIFINYCYNAWHLVLILSILWMAWSKRRKLRLHFFISLALAWVLLGTVLATLLFSAGPCYFEKVTGNTIPYTPLMTYLHSIPGLNAVKVQELLWNAYAEGTFMPLGAISAMPSMHVSVAVLVALMGRQVNRWLGYALACFAVIIQVGSVHLGWHYAIDGYCSALLSILIWKLVDRFALRKYPLHP